jgi:hypothetical protein
LAGDGSFATGSSRSVVVSVVHITHMRMRVHQAGVLVLV